MQLASVELVDFTSAESSEEMVALLKRQAQLAGHSTHTSEGNCSCGWPLTDDSDPLSCINECRRGGGSAG